MDINRPFSETDPQASCIRVTDSEDGTPYYVSATFRGDADGEECFDLEVTDLKRAWTATGHRRPNTSLYLDMWLAVAQEALTGVQDDALDTKKPAEPGASPYAWTVMADSGKIKLSWRFEMVKPDTGRYMTYKGNAEAGEAAHPGAIVESMVHQLVVNANTYKVSCLGLQKTVVGLREETEIAQAALDKEVTQREDREQDLYLKFAAVLNASKRKCREWRQKAELAEERLETGDATATERSESEAESTDMGDRGYVGVLGDVTSPAVAADNRMEEDTRPLSAPANEPEPAAEQPAAPDPESEPEPEVVPKRRVAAKKRQKAAPKRKETVDELMGPSPDFSSQY